MKFTTQQQSYARRFWVFQSLRPIQCDKSFCECPVHFNQSISFIWRKPDSMTVVKAWLYDLTPGFNWIDAWRIHTVRFFTQPPSGRRRMRICFADVFFLFFFCFFFVHQNYETTVLGNGWTDFHKTFTKRYRETWSLKRRAAAWRMANVDDLRNLLYDSFAITRGRHARRLVVDLWGLWCIINQFLIGN